MSHGQSSYQKKRAIKGKQRYNRHTKHSSSIKNDTLYTFEQYSRMGVESPFDVSQNALEQCLDQLRRDKPSTISIKRINTLLTSAILYDLGISQSPTNPKLAIEYLSESIDLIQSFSYKDAPQELNLITRNISANSYISYLRLSKEEYLLKAKDDTQKIGELILHGASHLNKASSYNVKEKIYASLTRSAFVGIFMSNQQDELELALPATQRQYSPHEYGNSEDEWLQRLKKKSIANLNIISLGSLNNKPNLTLAYAKPTYSDQLSNSYAPNILTLYGDQELFVGNIGEMKSFGRDLASCSHIPPKSLNIASENLQLAKELFYENQNLVNS